MVSEKILKLFSHYKFIQGGVTPIWTQGLDLCMGTIPYCYLHVFNIYAVDLVLLDKFFHYQSMGAFWCIQPFPLPKYNA